MSIFGEESNITFPEPEIPDCEPWNTLETLKREREVVGVYISGHPLDDYTHELRFFCNARLKHFGQLESLIGKELTFAGLITSAEHKLSKNNQGYCVFTVEDYEDSYEFRIFRDDYLKNKHMLSPNTFVYIQANVTKGWSRNTEDIAELKINIKQISPLQEVLDKKAQELYIKVDVNDFNQEKTERLIEIITRFRGDKKVVLELFDASESWAVDAFSRKHKVSADYEMLDALSKESVEFILN
ncbi:MAG: hypothetical protein RQ756_02235 [Flavobacteriaceae bacterium]|nr:hypothetical protein [Flavobacteriaceae bacterium]